MTPVHFKSVDLKLMISNLLLAAAFAPSARALAGPEASGEIPVYIGTYTDGDSEGIYRTTFNVVSGELTEPKLVGKMENPNFLAVSPDRRQLYAVGSDAQFTDSDKGAVAMFAVEPADGSLTLVTAQSSRGANPCHIVLDDAGKHALIANYSGGSVATLPIEDGKLQGADTFIQHSGSSVNKQRQEGPHAHSINLDAAGRFAFVADLGTDQVFIYKYDSQTGSLTPNDPPAVKLPPGSGPRHFAFHPSGRWAYVINELTSTVSAMAYDAERGALEVLQTISTLPEDFQGSNTTAEVVVHPSGKFLYGSNRGHDSIAMFAIDESTGQLTSLGQHPAGVDTPRNFVVDPTGKFLLAAGQDSNDIVVHRLDPATGKLEATDVSVSVPTPVCLKFVQPR
jgi:6-phosphogluconolactonase